MKNIKIEKWKDEFYCQTTYNSTLVKLCIDNTSFLPAQWLTAIRYANLKLMLKWLKGNHSYLLSNASQTFQLCEDVKIKTLETQQRL